MYNAPIECSAQLQLPIVAVQYKSCEPFCSLQQRWLEEGVDTTLEVADFLKHSWHANGPHEPLCHIPAKLLPPFRVPVFGLVGLSIFCNLLQLTSALTNMKL